MLAIAAMLCLSVSACTPAQSQEAPAATSTPAAEADVFDPAVAAATPIAGVMTYDDLSANHTTDPVTYTESPPVGGDHDPSWQRCKVYDAPIRNENAVHSLEHGAVWITYQPDLPAADRKILAKIARGEPYLLMSPYPGLDAPAVVTAWGAQLRLDDVADPRLPAFIARYAGNGPEPGATCDSGIEETVG